MDGLRRSGHCAAGRCYDCSGHLGCHCECHTEPADGLRGAEQLSPDERIAVWLALNAPEIREPYRLGRELAEWAEQRARERAAEELRGLGQILAFTPLSQRESGTVSDYTAGMHAAGQMATYRADVLADDGTAT